MMNNPITRRHSERGFSLIELLIVVAIIFTLATIAIPNYLSAKQSAYNASAISSLRHIHQAEVSYRASNAQYGDLSALNASGYLADPLLQAGHRSAYTFNVNATLTADNYEATAAPDVSPWRYYYVDASGVIRTATGTSASASSPPISY